MLNNFKTQNTNTRGVWNFEFRYWDLFRISGFAFGVRAVVAGLVPASEGGDGLEQTSPRFARGKIELTPFFNVKGAALRCPLVFPSATEHKSYVTVTWLLCGTCQYFGYALEQVGY